MNSVTLDQPTVSSLVRTRTLEQLYSFSKLHQPQQNVRRVKKILRQYAHLQCNYPF